MGYRHVRHYAGGIASWRERGGPVEAGAAPGRFPAAVAPPPAAPLVTRKLGSAGATVGSAGAEPRKVRRGDILLDPFLALVARASFGALLGGWLAMVLVFGIVYFLVQAGPRSELVEQGQAVTLSLHGLATSIYFSFVTATSVGFGDVVPLGPVRVLAIIEAAAGLLIFGAVISKLVSRRQEELTEEIHRISFEGRLGRVRTSLHLVLSELHAIGRTCEEGEPLPRRILPLLESSSMVFAGELHAVHDLLYRPQQVPDEQVMQSLLSTLASCMRQFARLADAREVGVAPSPLLRENLHVMSRLAAEVCGECVPREYAPELKHLMDEIQA